MLICVFLLAVNALLGYLMTKQSSDALITLIHNRMLPLKRRPLCKPLLSERSRGFSWENFVRYNLVMYK